MKTFNHALGRLGSYGPLIIRLLLGYCSSCTDGTSSTSD